MRFFSKITCICNVCFLISIILRVVENLHKQQSNYNGAIKLQPLESIVVILGYGAVLVNLFFFFISLYWIVNNKIRQLPVWIVLFNLVLFPVQLIYFLF